jgi:hypothetical protein
MAESNSEALMCSIPATRRQTPVLSQRACAKPEGSCLACLSCEHLNVVVSLGSDVIRGQ